MPGTTVGIGLNSPRISAGGVGLEVEGVVMRQAAGEVDHDDGLVRAAQARRASALSRSGKARPPIARPPILRNDRRETPSQYRRFAPNKVSIARSLPKAASDHFHHDPHWLNIGQPFFQNKGASGRGRRSGRGIATGSGPGWPSSVASRPCPCSPDQSTQISNLTEFAFRNRPRIGFRKDQLNQRFRHGFVAKTNPNQTIRPNPTGR